MYIFKAYIEMYEVIWQQKSFYLLLGFWKKIEGNTWV